MLWPITMLSMKQAVLQTEHGEAAEALDLLSDSPQERVTNVGELYWAW